MARSRAQRAAKRLRVPAVVWGLPLFPFFLNLFIFLGEKTTNLGRGGTWRARLPPGGRRRREPGPQKRSGLGKCGWGSARCWWFYGLGRPKTLRFPPNPTQGGFVLGENLVASTKNPPRAPAVGTMGTESPRSQRGFCGAPYGVGSLMGSAVTPGGAARLAPMDESFAWRDFWGGFREGFSAGCVRPRRGFVGSE